MGKRALSKFAKTPKELVDKMLLVLPKGVQSSSSPESMQMSQRILFGQVLEELIKDPKLVQSCHSHIQCEKAEMEAKEKEADLLPEMISVARIPPGHMCTGCQEK